MKDVKHFLQQLTSQPGVYLMKNAAGHIIYIGKAKNLHKRVSSYFSSVVSQPKTQALVTRIDSIDTIITSSESEALVLEANLIKQHRPRYNVLMRDDKSYPYLSLSQNDAFPRLDIHRGVKRDTHRYFGPFPSVQSVRETLSLIQKLFRVRQCSDVFFFHRSRPCLQYQINRCTAPCVDFVSEEMYREQINQVVAFLEGKSQDVMRDLQDKMQTASEARDYESAAKYRDQVALLRDVVAQQHESDQCQDVDVFAIVRSGFRCVISVLCVRGGRLLGKKDFHPDVPQWVSEEDALIQAIPQYYLTPENRVASLHAVILACPVTDKSWLADALSELFSCSIKVIDRKLGMYRAWSEVAIKNATSASLQASLVEQDYAIKFAALNEAFSFGVGVNRIECFDVSHTQGQATVASCVVFDENGPVKSAYRRFTIRGVTPGDDYAAMAQALRRHYRHIKKTDGVLPDLLLVDGGVGQLGRAAEVLDELQVSAVRLIGVAKGPGRKGGLETLHVWGRDEAVKLSPDSQASYLIQQVRDEAHRFAITLHRKQRGRALTQSRLELIPGIGAKRRAALLAHFGGWQQLLKASEHDIAQVKGVGCVRAAEIYHFLHSD